MDNGRKPRNCSRGFLRDENERHARFDGRQDEAVYPNPFPASGSRSKKFELLTR
jgi:hypothetical protein